MIPSGPLNPPVALCSDSTPVLTMKSETVLIVPLVA